MRRLLFAAAWLLATVSLFAQSTKVGGSGTTKVGGSGKTKGVSGSPVNTVLPLIDDNSPTAGDTISVTTGTWTRTPTSYTYQWKRSGVAISGATNTSYVTAAVVGGLSCYVTAHNAYGNSGEVRADSGLPRKIFFSGDSLTSSGGSPPLQSWVADLATLLGAGWQVDNQAVSGQNYDGGPPNMETVAQATIDPNIEVGWSVCFFFEYANQVTGIQGNSTGAETYDLIKAFGLARQAAGGIPIAATAPYNTANPGSKDPTQCMIASGLVRTNWADFSIGFAEFLDAALTQDIVDNDSVHWTSAVDSTVAGIVNDVIGSLGLAGYRGDIPVTVPDYTHLKTYTNNAYVYDPVNPLPNFDSPNVDYTGYYLKVLSGTGWTPGSYQILGCIPSFSTPDGTQCLYGVAGGPAAGGTPNGTYEWPPSVTP